jgi:glycosyltransferase involved in cell wall biosynthesis
MRIFLNMIVKNEALNMPSNLNSVKDLIDGVCILDTGSTDDTIQVIEDWCKSNEKFCKVHQEPFVNFGKSRTRSFELAQQAVSTEYGSEALKES